MQPIRRRSLDPPVQPQETSPQASQAPTLEPCAQIPVPPSRSGDALGGPVVFDDQHSIIYVRALDWTPHGWGIAKWYAPDAGAILLIAVLFVAFLRSRKILRHRQDPGSWYCRRCNYEVAGADFQGLCPECGRSAAEGHPRRGRSTRRRLVTLLIPCIAIITLCIAGLQWGLQRYEAGGPFNSLPWPTVYMGYLGRAWLFSKPLRVGGPDLDESRTNRYLRFSLPRGASAGPELPLVEGDNYGYV